MQQGSWTVIDVLTRKSTVNPPLPAPMPCNSPLFAYYSQWQFTLYSGLVRRKQEYEGLFLAIRRAQEDTVYGVRSKILYGTEPDKHADATWLLTSTRP